MGNFMRFLCLVKQRSLFHKKKKDMYQKGGRFLIFSLLQYNFLTKGGGRLVTMNKIVLKKKKTFLSTWLRHHQRVSIGPTRRQLMILYYHPCLFVSCSIDIDQHPETSFQLLMYLIYNHNECLISLKYISNNPPFFSDLIIILSHCQKNEEKKKKKRISSWFMALLG